MYHFTYTYDRGFTLAFVITRPAFHGLYMGGTRESGGYVKYMKNDRQGCFTRGAQPAILEIWSELRSTFSAGYLRARTLATVTNTREV